MESKPTAVVTVLYPKKNMSGFDMDYYLNHHIATTKAAWNPHGMSSCTVCEVTDDDAEFTVVVVMAWKDLGAWEEAKNGEAAMKLAADVQNFTNVTPIMIAGKVAD